MIIFDTALGWQDFLWIGVMILVATLWLTVVILENT